MPEGVDEFAIIALAASVDRILPAWLKDNCVAVPLALQHALALFFDDSRPLPCDFNSTLQTRTHQLVNVAGGLRGEDTSDECMGFRIQLV